jgi:hypothetical protein
MPRIGRQSVSITTSVPIRCSLSAFTTETIPQSLRLTWVYPRCRSLSTFAPNRMGNLSPSSPSWLITYPIPVRLVFTVT